MEAPQILKERLLSTYAEMDLEDIIPGEEFCSENGLCYNIKYEGKVKLNINNQIKAREKILSDLKLIYGIGESKERILKKDGYKTIGDLEGHPKFGQEAREFLKILDRADVTEMMEWLSNWVNQSHPLILFSSCFNETSDFIFLDIETLGLFRRPIILVGLAQIHDNRIIVNQYLSREIKEEKAVLSSFLSFIDEDSTFVSFNGKKFDIPYIKDRMAHHVVKGDLKKPHYDMLTFSRREWNENLPNCKLTTLEEHLFRIKREGDVPSALVPEFYQTYLETGNIGPLVPIIEHNRQDIITLARLFSKIHEIWG
ncbi:MAG: exonuclease [Euryarchaeota archaeon]|nr:exonuclease [Euryarchaeota archaeon]